LAASGVPGTLVAAVVIVAVKTEPVGKLLVGVKVAVLPVYVTVPAIAALLLLVSTILNVVAGDMRVDDVIGTLKLAVIGVVLAAMPVALFAGTVELTVGATKAASVVKLHTLAAAIALPARSLTPVEIVAVKVAPAVKLLFGVKVAVFVVTL
jgi:hypothetical protein